MTRPAASPDGKSIAFYRGPVLMMAGIGGQNERVLCESCDPAVRDVVWSPDSSQLLLVPSYQAKDMRLHLLTIATGRTRKLAASDTNRIASIVWPSWSSGPFLSEYVVIRGQIQSSQIWLLNLPQDEQIQVTQDPENIYFRIFGAGADGYSLIAQRWPPPPNGWDELWGYFTKFVWNPPQAYPRGQVTTVILTLKK